MLTYEQGLGGQLGIGVQVGISLSIDRSISIYFHVRGSLNGKDSTHLNLTLILLLEIAWVCGVWCVSCCCHIFLQFLSGFVGSVIIAFYFNAYVALLTVATMPLCSLAMWYMLKLNDDAAESKERYKYSRITLYLHMALLV